MIKVLFVCLGNICRSPTAHGVFQQLVDEQGVGRQIQIDSAGTHAYHVGKSPDARSQKAALARGVDLSALRARQVCPEDFDEFDYVLAMDESNLENLREICPAGQAAKLELFLKLAPQLPEQEVPDPYYGGGSGFEHVLDLVEAASKGLLEDIRQNRL